MKRLKNERLIDAIERAFQCVARQRFAGIFSQEYIKGL
jgi:hypothetical protein